MERIMPIDLENPGLRKSLLGYERKSVDRLISGAAKTLQDLLIENDNLRQELERQRADADALRGQESTLKEVLVLAQRAAEETRMLAQKQAEATLEDARQAALAERMACQQKLSELKWDIERLRTERSRYADEFQSLLARHQRELSTIIGLTVVTGEGNPAAAGA